MIQKKTDLLLFKYLMFIALFLLIGCAKEESENSGPTFTTAGSNQTLKPGETYSLTVQATDDEGDAITWSASTLPDWLTFNTATQTLSGTPYWLQVGENFNITITASDGKTDTKNSFVLTIKEGNVSAEAATRLLTQSTFGPTSQLISDVTADGMVQWVDRQLAMPSAYDATDDSWKSHLQRTIEIAKMAEPTSHPDSYNDYVNHVKSFNSAAADFQMRYYQMAAWWENSLKNRDQLRQRVAYALSQLLVTSTTAAPLHRRAEALAYYYDILAKHAFGNYRDLLSAVAFSPTMGIYLSHQGNKKADSTKKTRPDENFAREITQLFTIGLYELNSNGTPKLNQSGKLIPTYTQTDVEELSKVMTGWDIVGNSRYGRISSTGGDFTQQMEFSTEYHETSSKTVLGKTIQADLSGKEDMNAAIDILFAHSNVAPYVSKHLITRLVTSNPSPAYVKRVSAVFDNNGNGVKGDLRAVVRAILLDREARGDAYKNDPNFGKANEPILCFSRLMRAFNVVPLDGWKSKDNETMNGIYWFRSPENSFGQAPMRSSSVFNFYSPDFIPSNTYFAANKLVAPELQIQSDQMLVNYSNRVVSVVDTLEKNALVHNHGTPATYAANRTYGSTMLFYIDFTPQLNLLEQVIDGDTNGDFINMNDPSTDTDGDTRKDNAVEALLDHLNLLLMNNRMPNSYRSNLKAYLADVKSSDDTKEARYVVREAVKFITTSSFYMIQK